VKTRSLLWHNKGEEKPMQISVHQVFEVTEWDGSRNIVKIVKTTNTQISAVPQRNESVTMRYSDGKEHEVTKAYFEGDLKAKVTDYRRFGLKIVSVEFKGEGLVEVVATLSSGVEEKLFSFYSDELRFSPADFVGKTVEQARQLHFERDKAYLQS
jgi:hypothetical protein